MKAINFAVYGSFKSDRQESGTEIIQSFTINGVEGTLLFPKSGKKYMGSSQRLIFIEDFLENGDITVKVNGIECMIQGSVTKILQEQYFTKNPQK